MHSITLLSFDSSLLSSLREQQQSLSPQAKRINKQKQLILIHILHLLTQRYYQLYSSSLSSSLPLPPLSQKLPLIMFFEMIDKLISSNHMKQVILSNHTLPIHLYDHQERKSSVSHQTISEQLRKELTAYVLKEGKKREFLVEDEYDFLQSKLFPIDIVVKENLTTKVSKAAKKAMMMKKKQTQKKNVKTMDSEGEEAATTTAGGERGEEGEEEREKIVVIVEVDGPFHYRIDGENKDALNRLSEYKALLMKKLYPMIPLVRIRNLNSKDVIWETKKVMRRIQEIYGFH
jgi:hypothetical protein